jgi:hypothetical protein
MKEENQEELLSIAHMNYVDETRFSSDPTWFKAVPCMDRMRGELKIGYRQYAKEEFIDQCKTNPEFSEKWGLKIEERELNVDELNIINLLKQTSTKLITITYNDKTIESYA